MKTLEQNGLQGFRVKMVVLDFFDAHFFEPILNADETVFSARELSLLHSVQNILRQKRVLFTRCDPALFLHSLDALVSSHSMEKIDVTLRELCLPTMHKCITLMVQNGKFAPRPYSHSHTMMTYS